jgi:hypothetical protein
MTGEEHLKSYAFFNGKQRDGTLIEIPHSLHKKYSKQIHGIITKSFRWDRSKDDSDNSDGKRRKSLSQDGKDYNLFRTQYWKLRSEQFGP